ncbi:MAG: hypothetical protein RR051_05175, partial [Clostridiales bacterium]
MDKNENKPNYKKISPNYNWENEIAVPENLEENKFSGYPTPPSKIFSINDIARLAEEEESRITIEATATSPIASDTSINNHGQTYSHRSPEPLPADVLKTTTSFKAEEEAQRLGDEKAKLAIELAEKRKAAIAAKQAAENAMRKVEEETRRKEAEAHRHAAEMIHREAEETEAKRKLAEETRRKEILTTQLQFQEPYNLHAQTGKQTPIFPPPTTTASQTTDEEARILAMAEAKRATEKAVQKVAAEAHQKAADSQYQMSPTTNQPLQTTIKNNIIPGVFNQNFMQNQPTTSKPQTIDNRHANLETINQTDNLPYPDTNLEGLFKLASEAESQAQFAATAARNASTAAHANMMNMTPENPVVANKIQQSTFAAAKNAVEAAKAALKAQSSAMEATAAAISQSMRELDRNKALIQQQETSIIKLNANMDNAQTAISKALEAFRAAKMKAEEEAARIQEYKNQLFQAAQEKQALEQYMLKAQENLNFAHVRARETRANYLNIQTLTEATEKDLYCIVHSIPLQQPYPATPVSINYQNQTNTQPLFPDQNNSSAKNTPAEAPNREQTID